MPPEAKSSDTEWPLVSAAARAYRPLSTSSSAMGTGCAAPTARMRHSAGTAPAWMAAALE